MKKSVLIFIAIFQAIQVNTLPYTGQHLSKRAVSRDSEGNVIEITPGVIGSKNNGAMMKTSSEGDLYLKQSPNDAKTMIKSSEVHNDDDNDDDDDDGCEDENECDHHDACHSKECCS